MKAVLKTAALGVGLLAFSSGMECAHAASQTMTNGQEYTISSSTTYVYGDTTFSFACVACGNFGIYAVSNGRGGTEIEIENSTTTSPILSATTTDLSASFTVTVGLSSGNHGVSMVTNILSGSATNGQNSLVTSVLSSFKKNGTSFTPTGTQSSTLATNSQVSTIAALIPSGNTLTFTDTLHAYGSQATAGSTLKLTNIALLFNPAPEPASIALVVTGLVGMGVARRSFRRGRS